MFRTRRPGTGVLALGLFLGTAAAGLQGEEAAAAAAAPAEAISLADTLWVLVASILVFFMQTGFAMVETGFTRAKNSVNILFKNLMDFCLATVAFWAVGFGIMFGTGNGFLGLEGWFLADAGGTFASLDWAKVPLPAKFFFQLVFAGTAATIVSGAMAERTRFSAYLIYSFAISLVFYPVVGHWIWGGGWLAGAGMWDFAGSTVVHSVGGWFALVGAWILGPRLGKYGPDGRARAIPGHNIPLAALGVFILWVGWFGFNPGSTMAASANIGHIAVTTNLAAATGGIAGMLASWTLFRKPDLSMAMNGVLAGLVAITAPCAFVSAGSAALIGLAAGIAVVLSVIAVDRVLRIDDPVGAISVHLVCGILGTLAVGLFAEDRFSPGTTGNGLLFGGGLRLLGAQSLGVLAVGGWCVAAGLALFGGLKALFGLRVSREEEIRGLDLGEHGMESYAGFQIFMNQ